MEPGLVFLWGAAGGFAAATFVYLLPILTGIAEGESFEVSRHRVAASAVLLALLTITAGLVPLIPDAVTRGQAITLGLASQVFLKGITSGAYEWMVPGRINGP